MRGGGEEEEDCGILKVFISLSSISLKNEN